MLEYFILYPKFLDCTDILMDGWFQSFLLRQSGTSLKDDDDDDDDDVRAGAKPTVMTFREDSNGHQYCVYTVIFVSAAVVLTASSHGSQQDDRDIGALVIDHLTAGVSTQCELMACQLTPAAKPAVISVIRRLCCVCNYYVDV